tara:strand:- start:321 stop:584 length:264 start_codon:yes stop_codon:yes gene_type:complete
MAHINTKTNIICFIMLLAFPLLFSPYSDFSCKNNLRAIFPDYAGRYNTLTISKQQSRVEADSRWPHARGIQPKFLFSKGVERSTRIS